MSFFKSSPRVSIKKKPTKLDTEFDSGEFDNFDSKEIINSKGTNGSFESKGSKGSLGSIFSLDSADNEITSPSNKMAKKFDILTIKEKEKFSEYTTKTHNQENENFLYSVQHFKKNYDSKTDKWRYNVSFRIVKTYITINSSMQINISHSLRDTIIDNIKPDINIPVDVFDSALIEIVNILANGVWKDFIKEIQNDEEEMSKISFIDKILKKIKKD